MATTISIDSDLPSSSFRDEPISGVTSALKTTSPEGQQPLPMLLTLNEEMETTSLSSMLSSGHIIEYRQQQQQQRPDTQGGKHVEMGDEQEQHLYTPYPFHQRSKEEVDDFEHLMMTEFCFADGEEWSLQFADEITCMSVDTDDQVSFYCDDDDEDPLRTLLSWYCPAVKDMARINEIHETATIDDENASRTSIPLPFALSCTSG